MKGIDTTSRGASVAVTIVTFNSARYIADCLRSVFAQDFPSLQVIVIDNASSDESVSILQQFSDRITLIVNRENTGFAAAQNQAIALAEADWILTLNPDVQFLPAFIAKLVDAGEDDSDVGTVCGKLLAGSIGPGSVTDAVFDSTGIYMTPNMRHFDRGSRLPDHGEYQSREYVFGATGAAALYRRKMIEAISLSGEFFDVDFFAYREDADVAWRAQLLGWKCLYVPEAVAFHVRTVLPSNRRSLPAVINMHSVKNRFLLRIKNATAGLYRRFWFAMTKRDLAVIAGCLVFEWSSLRAFPLLLRMLPGALKKRREVMRQRKVSDEYITSWFSDQPVAIPAPEHRAVFMTGDRGTAH
jgi:GT2 family glycosyltransferase